MEWTSAEERHPSLLPKELCIFRTHLIPGYSSNSEEEQRAYLKWCKDEGHHEGQGPIEQGGLTGGKLLHVGGEQFTWREEHQAV